jgi:3-hydroxybutyryl-CoA dehydrogenase
MFFHGIAVLLINFDLKLRIMHTIVVGYRQNHDEFRQKLPEVQAMFIGPEQPLPSTGENPLVIWDFCMDEDPDRLRLYKQYEPGDCLLFANLVRTGLSHLLAAYELPKLVIVSFCGMPGFFNRPLLELSVHKESQKAFIEEILSDYKTEAVFVEDRVGMITPRVVCMIINEAYYTLQEGTATKQDIDLGMKLGTNYPYGPFEWAGKIGLAEVYRLLDALWLDTREERYKICPLLKKEMLLAL